MGDGGWGMADGMEFEWNGSLNVSATTRREGACNGHAKTKARARLRVRAKAKKTKDEMGWDGMGWDGMGWHGMGPYQWGLNKNIANFPGLQRASLASY